MKTYDISIRTSKQARECIQAAIETHKQHQGSLIPSFTTEARKRSKMQFDSENKPFVLVKGTKKISVSWYYIELAHKVSYSMKVNVNGVSSDVRSLIACL